MTLMFMEGCNLAGYGSLHYLILSYSRNISLDLGGYFEVFSAWRKLYHFTAWLVIFLTRSPTHAHTLINIAELRRLKYF